MGARRSGPGQGTIVFLIEGPIARPDLPGLCQRMQLLVEQSDAGLVICDVGAVRKADAVTVDAVARLQLIVRRLGRQLRVRNACASLQELLGLMGLKEVVRLY
jgi:ABC-type transporter Mla MlaB component